jgi:methanogenic corrinoid protein MtbC1
MSESELVHQLREALWDCLREHDRERAIGAVLKAVESGLPIEELYTMVLMPFLVSVGRSWQEGVAAVWEEHLIVGAVRAAVEALYPQVMAQKERVSPVPVTVAFFCPPQEAHDIGLRMLADRFDLRGFRTVYVGAMTPVTEMIACVRAVEAQVACLSASTHYQRAALLTVVETLEEELPGVRLVVGGPAFLRPDPGWEKYAPDSVEHLLEELTGALGAQPGGEVRDA